MFAAAVQNDLRQFSRGKRAIRKHSIKLGFGGNRGALLAADRRGGRNRYSVRRQPILRRHGVLANCTVGPPAGLIKSNHRQFCPRETLADLRLLSLCSSFRAGYARRAVSQGTGLTPEEIQTSPFAVRFSLPGLKSARRLSIIGE